MVDLLFDSPMSELNIFTHRPHKEQLRFLNSSAPRRVLRAGRRSGKTTAAAMLAVKHFGKPGRVLYATPTAEQIDRFWFEVQKSLREPLNAGVFYKNESRHIIEKSGTEQRIRAKTAWNADMLRGDWASLLILDEWQLMHESTWGQVGAPMLLDREDNMAVFIYTPPSIRQHGMTRADDPMHAAKLFKRAAQDESGRWATFHFTSHDNPYISEQALEDITLDMSSLAYRQEILAEDIEDNPGALWKRAWIRDNRVMDPPDLARVAVAVDPTASKSGDECGIVGGGMDVRDGSSHLYVLEDASLHGSPDEWGRAAVTLYRKLGADILVAEKNNGGEMVEHVIKTIDPDVRMKLVHASRGKHVRAEPISAVYEQGRGHHVGTFALLEDEQCQWEPGQDSPNRMDALVWLGTELVIRGGRPVDIFLPGGSMANSRWR